MKTVKTLHFDFHSVGVSPFISFGYVMLTVGLPPPFWRLCVSVIFLLMELGRLHETHYRKERECSLK